MIINTAMARADWAARVRKQAEEMLIISGATTDQALREEFLTSAARLDEHARRLAADAAGG